MNGLKELHDVFKSSRIIWTANTDTECWSQTYSLFKSCLQMCRSWCGNNPRMQIGQRNVYHWRQDIETVRTIAVTSLAEWISSGWPICYHTRVRLLSTQIYQQTESLTGSDVKDSTYTDTITSDGFRSWLAWPQQMIYNQVNNGDVDLKADTVLY